MQLAEPDPEFVNLILWLIFVGVTVYIGYYFKIRFSDHSNNLDYIDHTGETKYNFQFRSEPFQLSPDESEIGHLKIQEETPSIQYFEKNHCGNCNNKREPNDVFCSYCGGLLK